MTGKVVQLSVSKGGIPKLPIQQSQVTTYGLREDRHAHPAIHGGPRQAILLITSEGLEELKQLGYPLFHGALGENLTTQGWGRRGVRIGQRYRVGPDVVIEITKVRGPCETLNIYGAGIQKALYDAEVKAGNSKSSKWGLSGFYAAVVQTGTIREGDPLILLDEAV
jgi:MOSC domain-containing protein YiiM